MLILLWSSYGAFCIARCIGRYGNVISQSSAADRTRICPSVRGKREETAAFEDHTKLEKTIASSKLDKASGS